MSRFYGTLQGNRGAVTRTGSQDITAAAQSYDGSIITQLSYDKNNHLEVRISISDGSSSGGWGSDEIFRGSLDEFKKRLSVK